MLLNKLTLKDKALFRRVLGLRQHELSVYAFENIYIWKGLFDIYWRVIKDNLCVFFEDKIGCFLYLAPLGKKIRAEAIKEAFKIMDEFNANCDISRIENIEEKDIDFYRRLGYACQDKYPEYLCRRTGLAQLKGSAFKSKRACFNYFIKNYPFEYLPFSLKYKDSCLKLYNRWMKERKAQNKDAIYQGMLEDSRACLQILLDAYSNLDFAGRVVKIGQKIKGFTPLQKVNDRDNSVMGFTFGFKLNKDTLCILYEITDLSIKGLAQFIFRSFCAELKDYKYINIMDDSGLENLKKVKLSYRPTRLIPAYIVKRKND